MTLSAIHNITEEKAIPDGVVCDIGGYDFVSYSQPIIDTLSITTVVCDIGGYDFVSYSQHHPNHHHPLRVVCDIGGYDFVSYSQLEIAAFLASTSCL